MFSLSSVLFVTRVPRGGDREKADQKVTTVNSFMWNLRRSKKKRRLFMSIAMLILLHGAGLIRPHECTAVYGKVVIEKIQPKVMRRCVSASRTVSVEAVYMCMLPVELTIEEAVKRKRTSQKIRCSMPPKWKYRLALDMKYVGVLIPNLDEWMSRTSR